MAATDTERGPAGALAAEPAALERDGAGAPLEAQREDLVAFDKYAASAERLTSPSSAARAIAAGAPMAERVDRLVQLIGRQHGIAHPAIDRSVALLDAKIAGNQARAA